MFITRDDGPRARQTITTMANQWMTNANQRQKNRALAVVLFPEGRLFTPKVHDRSMKKLAERDPDRATRLAPLTGLLPPKSGGLGLLLEALPTADVVLLNHSGLDSLGKISKLPKHLPVGRSVTVSAARIPRKSVPEQPDELTRWLDDLWLDLDRQLTPKN